MGYDLTWVGERLLALKNRVGSWAALGRMVGTTGYALSRNSRGEVEMSTDTWEKLYKAFPLDIPPPPWSRLDSNIPNRTVEYLDFRFKPVPVFDAGAGPNNLWNDGGFPLGTAEHYIYEPEERIDQNTFGVRAHGDSMEPNCRDADIAVVVPSLELQHGKMCFASWPGEDGPRLIRRYFKYDTTIVLKPDNPAAGEEITLNESNSTGVNIYRVGAIRRENP